MLSVARRKHQSPTNRDIAELLAVEAERHEGHRRKAHLRAARRAYVWEEEAAVLLLEGKPLTDLPGVGPYLSRVIAKWITDPPEIPDPPEARRDFLTLTGARRILEASGSYRPEGDLQMHTRWSDGYASIADYAEEGERLGYEYLAITDHSVGLKIAGGMDETQLSQQQIEIDEVNSLLESRDTSLRLLPSIEMNLNPEGRGDMPLRSLEKLHLVLGAFHSKLRAREDQTPRYLAALENRSVHVLAHPKGRIFNFRTGLEADWPVVFEAAASEGKAVEIDCFPDRQDLSVSLLRLAKETDVVVSIGTDAHHPSQLRYIDLGLAAAVAAGFPPSRILNLMGRRALLEWLSR